MLKSAIDISEDSIIYWFRRYYFVIMFTVMLDRLIKRIEVLEAKLAEVCAERDLYKTKYEEAVEKNNKLRGLIKDLQRHRFGSRSERFIDPELPTQDESLSDICDAEDFPKITESKEDDKVIPISAHKRRTRNSKLPTNLPLREVIIKAEDNICSCGSKKTLLKYIISKRLHMIPERYEIIVQKREVVVCSRGCKNSLSTAPNPLRILPKTQVTEEFLANTIISKLHDRQPLYHMEQKLKNRFGFEIARNKLARWFINTSKALQPLVNLMKDEIIDYDIASCDPTSIQVLSEPDRKATQKSYWYCFRGGPPDKKVILYDYNPSSHKKYLVNWFTGFKGYIHVDAQNIFGDLAKQSDVSLVYCNAHARRKYESITKVTKREGLAKEAVRIYRELYKIEDHIKVNNYNFSQSFIYRLNMTKPITDKYQKWLEKYYPTTLPTSSLGKALAYSINHWKGLTTYLNDGRLSIDNNHTEQEIKPAVMSRKNFLFAYSVAGVKALCVHMSLIRSAILHGLDPYHYYVAIMKAVPYCRTVEDYEKLLPWAISLSKVEVVTEQEKESAV